MTMMIVRQLNRRAVLRGAGVCLALPFLEAMRPRSAGAQVVANSHFFGFFYPNGTERNLWVPAAGPLTPDSLSQALVDFAGFEAEGDWPAGGPVYEDVTVLGGINHSGVSTDIHEPALAFCAHKGARKGVPGAPTLDQAIANEIGGETPYRNLALSASNDQDITQGNISFREDGQVASTLRDPRQLYQQLFGMTQGGDDGAAPVAARQSSLLDHVMADAARLNQRLGSEDKKRVDEYLTAVSELGKQLGSAPVGTCTAPEEPAMGGDWHTKSKLFIDMGVLAMACGLTRVVTMQYSDSWGVHYDRYDLGEGIEGLGNWSDHFISHKLGDTDRATDLDKLSQSEATRIANLRVVKTGRFKARRFAYLVEKLKSYPTENGTLLDDTLAMFVAENGDGDSHSRENIPVLLAGHVGGFKTGRSLTVKGNTGALHASILGYFGIEASNYGNPMGNPIAEI
jgi:hypothetical protein